MLALFICQNFLNQLIKQISMRCIRNSDAGSQDFPSGRKWQEMQKFNQNEHDPNDDCSEWIFHQLLLSYNAFGL